jgi:hypothetical protein
MGFPSPASQIPDLSCALSRIADSTPRALQQHQISGNAPVPHFDTGSKKTLDARDLVYY